MDHTHVLHIDEQATCLFPKSVSLSMPATACNVCSPYDSRQDTPDHLSILRHGSLLMLESAVEGSDLKAAGAAAAAGLLSDSCTMPA
jgi:hypothetical protein